MSKICVFAGTSEGRQLVELLAGRGLELTACVATEYGGALLGEAPGVRVRAGRMDARQMADFIEWERFDLVVDATHPYAAEVTRNIFAACARAGAPCLRLLRQSGAGAGDGAFVPDAATCAELLRGVEGNILLTTGSKELPAFCALPELRGRVYVRVLPMETSLRICAACGIHPDHILAMQGPFDEEMNLAMLRFTRARWLVTKDTGDAGGYAAKLRAAERAGAGVVVIGRPPQREGMALEGVLAEIERRFELAPPRKRVVLAGVGMGGPDTQTLGLRRAVAEADCLIGARRMLEAVDCAGKRAFEAVAPAEIARIVRESPDRRFAVLLSGDTGFYSGAKKLIAELEDVELEVLPGIGSLQYFCAKLRRPWEDVRAVSLHGRDCDLAREVREHAAVFALVGGEGGAKRALARLRDAGLGDRLAHVGERLGYPQERVTTASVRELAERDFDPLSVVLIEGESCENGSLEGEGREGTGWESEVRTGERLEETGQRGERLKGAGREGERLEEASRGGENREVEARALAPSGGKFISEWNTPERSEATAKAPERAAIAGATEKPEREFATGGAADMPECGFTPGSATEKPEREFATGGAADMPARGLTPGGATEKPGRGFAMSGTEKMPACGLTPGGATEKPEQGFDMGGASVLTEHAASSGASELSERIAPSGASVSFERVPDNSTSRFEPASQIGEPLAFGLRDEAFERADVPMTKSEVRAVSLSKLMLTRGAVVYDVGTGSGSVAVECARLAREGKVYAVERKPEALALARRNAERFGLGNVEFVAGEAPGVLEPLPAPTHVFIGGSGGSLRRIVDCIIMKNPAARIVVNAVTLETLAELTELSKEFEYRDIAQLSLSKPREIGGYSLMTAQNPVYIFTLQTRRPKPEK